MFWLAEADTEERGPGDDYWYEPLGFPNRTGVRVTPDGSLALPAVYSCVRVITDAIMQVPLILYRRKGDGGQDKERAVDDRRYSLLHDQPNPRQTAPEWREIIQHHLLLRGNAYSPKVENGGGQVVELEHPHHPDYVNVEPFRDSTMRMRARYRLRPVKTYDRERTLDESQILHLHGLATDGFCGMSPIQAEREALGLGLAAQEFLARYYKNDARPGGVIESPKNFPNKAARDRFRESFEDALRGQDRHKTAVLEFGMKYTPLELKLVDQQFLELRKYQNHEIARIFRVPPHMIMEMDRSTFNNIEHQSISFVKNTMLPWFVRWEKRLAASLLGTFGEEASTDLFFEFLVDGLERGDLKTRTQHYHFGVQDGYLTRNEVRQKENLNKLPGLDEPLEPGNMRRAGDDPEDDDTDERDGRRMDELERNTAQALAKKQAHGLARAVEREQSPDDYLLGTVDDVARMMVFDDGTAADVVHAALADLHEDGITLEDWQTRHFDRLMEASRSL